MGDMLKKVCLAAITVCAVRGLGAQDVSAVPALTHRWSFNDWNDSVGGATAQKTGAYAALYAGRVHTGYGGCGHDTGNVNLGANLLDTTGATLELWVRQDGVEKYSRVFTYAQDSDHFVHMAFSLGTDISKDEVGAKNSGTGDETDVQDTMAPYEIGTDYHIAVTFKRQGDGMLVSWQRRDAATGELQKTGSLEMTGGIHTFVDPVLSLARSVYTGNCDAMAAYDEVRVWRGVLSDAELAASAAAGPDAAIAIVDGEVRFTAAEPAEPPAGRVAMPDGAFRIMTYNINYAYDAETKTIIEDRIADRIIAENPDFCCLNEIRDSVGHPESTMLAKLTGMHRTHNHNTILSKEEPLNVESCDLPWASYGDRGVLICEFTNVVVAVTHLDVGQEAFAARTNSIDIIRKALEKYAAGAKPVILAGDWNAGVNSAELQQIKEFMTVLSPTAGRTYHNRSATGGYVIDYIAVDTAHAEDIYTSSSYIIDDIAASDHNPVFAEIYIRPRAEELGWVDERLLSTGRTGAWSVPVRWDTAAWAAALSGENVFTANEPSSGNEVEFDVTVAFDAIPNETITPAADAQGALWLGMNGSFQIWTANGWLDVAAEGVTPAIDVEYTFRFTFDYRAKRYSAAVLDAGEYKTLAANGEAAFPLVRQETKASAVKFTGDGLLRSLAGRYAELEIELFSEDENVSVKDGIVQLTSSQAAWLNALGDKATAAGAAAGLSQEQFRNAHLLNWDITAGASLDECEFEITGINIKDDAVELAIQLVRPGAVKEGGVAKPINGVLRVYGAQSLAELRDAARADATPLADDFGDGATQATATIERTGAIEQSAGTYFFKAVVE